jgi:hypothetical protein
MARGLQRMAETEPQARVVRILVRQRVVEAIAVS